MEQACPDQYLIPAFGYDEVSKMGHNKTKSLLEAIHILHKIKVPKGSLQKKTVYFMTTC